MEAGQRFSATTPFRIVLPESDNKCDESQNRFASNQGSPSAPSAIEGNMHFQEDCCAMRRCSSSRGFAVVGAGAKVGESNIVSRSESPTIKRSKHEGLNMMSVNVHAWKSKSKSNAVKIMEPGVSAISTKMFEYKDLKADKMIQASLKTQERELRNEVSRLKERLSSYSDDCFKLRKENKALLDKLRHECSKEEIVELEIKNPDKDAPPSDSSSDESGDDVDLE